MVKSDRNVLFYIVCNAELSCSDFTKITLVFIGRDFGIVTSHRSVKRAACKEAKIIKKLTDFVRRLLHAKRHVAAFDLYLSYLHNTQNLGAVVKSTLRDKLSICRNHNELFLQVSGKPLRQTTGSSHQALATVDSNRLVY